jgi:hypothetical protein
LISSRSTGTPVALNIIIRPGVEFKSVERYGLLSLWDFGDIRANFRIELVAVHAEIARRIAQPDQPWQQLQAQCRRPVPPVFPVWSHDE